MTKKNRRAVPRNCTDTGTKTKRWDTVPVPPTRSSTRCLQLHQVPGGGWFQKTIVIYYCFVKRKIGYAGAGQGENLCGLQVQSRAGPKTPPPQKSHVNPLTPS